MSLNETFYNVNKLQKWGSQQEVDLGGSFILTDFNEKEKWIAITSIMKTSATVKQLPKEMVDYLFINLRREEAPHLTDDDVKFIEQQIMNTAEEVKTMCFKSATKFLGEGDVNEAIKQLTGIVGEEKASVIKKLFGKSVK